MNNSFSPPSSSSCFSARLFCSPHACEQQIHTKREASPRMFFSVQAQEIAISSLNISITWFLIVAFVDWILSIFTERGGGGGGGSDSIYAIFKIVKLVGFALIRICFVYLVINLRVISLRLFGCGSKEIRMRCKIANILFSIAWFTQHELDSNR